MHHQFPLRTRYPVRVLYREITPLITDEVNLFGYLIRAAYSGPPSPQGEGFFSKILQDAIMKRILTFALVICFLLSGCAGSDSKLTKTVLAMDTVMTLTIYGGTEQHLEEAGQLIKELDDKLSATNDASETNRINSSGGIAAEVSDKMLYLTKQSIALGSSTNGALDVTLTPVIRAWGFLGGDYRVPDNAELESLLEKVDYSKIETGNGTVTLPKGMEISFGAVAKGYAGDLLMELFSSQGIESAIVTLGGNVQALGLKPDGSKWNVAVQDPFSYVLVDEYQDTNYMQYLLTSLLAGGYENICVVGDDDQSIYRFRGATIENILNFEKQYKGSRVIRLEQNYRSTQSILNAANAVIAHNIGRKGKRLWTANGEGEPITVYEAADEGAEANFVAGQIISRSKGKAFRDYAVLYRTNAQSNALEFAFKRNGIPYRVIGGMRFFDRAEVKDMLSYLCVINNRNDDLRLNRIINNPPRGIGAKTVETADRLAQAEGKGLYSVVSDPYSYGPLEKAAGKLMQFTVMIEELSQLLDEGMSLPEFYEEVMRRSGYITMLESKPTEENKTRLENIRELKSSIQAYVQNADIPTLAGFLEEIALYTDLEQYNESDDAAVMMTMHSAKGLEFPNVFLVGFEDGLFPGMRAIGEPEEMEEERRLCYVAITRAKKNLTISYAKQRMLYGRTNASLPSRFLREIPENMIVKKGGYHTQRPADSYAPAQPRYDYAAAINRIAPTKTVPYDNTTKAAYLELNKGDMVQHTAFGKGMVLSVIKMGGDALLEIAFDQIGTKKLMAKTASAHMRKL